MYKKTTYDHLGNEFPSIKNLCDHYKITTTTYLGRIKHGWPLEKTLTTPSQKRHQGTITDHLGNHFPSIKAMCEHYGITKTAYNNRIALSWSLEKILTTPIRQAQNPITDHANILFPSIVDMCAHYGITVSSYHHRLKKGWSIEKILAKPTVKKQKATAIDHLGNKFSSITKMCAQYNINKGTYQSRTKFGWSTLEKLNIIPHITYKTKNADIIPNLRVLNHVCDNTYLVIHNGTETLMHYDEIIRFATEYFRAQNEQNTATA